MFFKISVYTDCMQNYDPDVGSKNIRYTFSLTVTSLSINYNKNHTS